MHTYDRKRAEQIIAEESGGELVATNDYHSTNYVFTNWKHALYDEDDDRSRFIGGGPLVFYKNTGEYRFSGTGDLIMGTFGDEMDEAYGTLDNDVPYETRARPTKVQVIAGIQRRGFVNDEDRHWLFKYLEQMYPGIGEADYHRAGGNYNFAYRSTNPEHITAITTLWDSFGFGYHSVENVLLLHREKK